MYRSQLETRKSAPRNMPPVPTGTFAVLPLALWARLWSRRSLRRIATGMRALRLVQIFANDA